MFANLKIKVMVVDDHVVVRQGLVRLLKSFPDFEVVATAENGQMALTLCKHHQPDVVLMDLLMPGMSGTAGFEVQRKTTGRRLSAEPAVGCGLFRWNSKRIARGRLPARLTAARR